MRNSIIKKTNDQFVNHTAWNSRSKSVDFNNFNMKPIKFANVYYEEEINMVSKNGVRPFPILFKEFKEIPYMNLFGLENQ